VRGRESVSQSVFLRMRRDYQAGCLCIPWYELINLVTPISLFICFSVPPTDVRGHQPRGEVAEQPLGWDGKLTCLVQFSAIQLILFNLIIQFCPLLCSVSVLVSVL
jgi:hypothetical protein